MKFDMGAAWNDAMAMVAANKDVLGIVAAVFFFLPSLMLSVIAPGTELEAAAGDPERMSAALNNYFISNAWLFGLVALTGWVGSLSVYALLGRHQNVTVGEAISIGLKATLPYIAYIIGFIVLVVALSSIVGVVGGATGSGLVAFILGVVMFAAIIVISIRLVLVGPVMAVDGILNPITAAQRSWALIKGNTRRVFVFFVLLVIAIIVVAIILSIVFALIGALLGPTGALWVQGIFGGIMGTVFTVIFLAVYSATHQQLSGGAAPSDVATFE
jgi:hypothetical protein